MTYPELLIALDIGNPEDVLSNISNAYYDDLSKSKYCRCYFIVCDDGDIHCFDKDGIEQKIDYIPYYCFVHRFFKKIIIPETVASIGYSAFFHCRYLTSVTIPNNVRSIELDTFWGCSSLKSVIFKEKTMEQVKTMNYYPWGIEDESIIQAGL